MYAVIKTGGKQHKVKPGDVIEVELMHGGHGEAVTFTPLLVVDDEGKTHVGKELGKAQVTGKLVGEEKGDKVKIFKYRPKTGYSRRQGHRQLYTLVEIEGVSLGKRAATKKAEAPSDDKVEAPAADQVEAPAADGAEANPDQPEGPVAETEVEGAAATDAPAATDATAPSDEAGA